MNEHPNRERGVSFTLRLTNEEHALVKRAAGVDQRSLQTFILRAAVRQARAVLRQDEQVTAGGR